MENINLIWMFDLIFRLVRNPLSPQPLVQLPKSFLLLYPLIVVFAEVFIPIFAKLFVMNCKPGTTLTMLVLSASETSPVPNFPGIYFLLNCLNSQIYPFFPSCTLVSENLTKSCCFILTFKIQLDVKRWESRVTFAE